MLLPSEIIIILVNKNWMKEKRYEKRITWIEVQHETIAKENFRDKNARVKTLLKLLIFFHWIVWLSKL